MYRLTFCFFSDTSIGREKRKCNMRDSLTFCRLQNFCSRLRFIWYLVINSSAPVFSLWPKKSRNRGKGVNPETRFTSSDLVDPSFDPHWRSYRAPRTQASINLNVTFIGLFFYESNSMYRYAKNVYLMCTCRDAPRHPQVCRVARSHCCATKTNQNTRITNKSHKLRGSREFRIELGRHRRLLRTEAR